MALPTLVTIHGLGLDAASFAPMLARVATRFDVHGVDLPGFGARRDAPWTSVDAVAHDVAREITLAAGDEPWMLVGHSMGGRIASIVAALLRDAGAPMPAGMALLAPSPVTREPMPAAKRTEMLDWARTGAIDADAARAFVDANVGSPLPANLDARAVRTVRSGDAAAWIAWLESGSREDWHEEVGALDVPAVIVAGDADDDLGSAAQPTLAAATHPRARHVALAGAGHLIPLERPAEVAAAVDELWQQHA
ncbi:alpha/beta fold hydrolase [Agrococcus jejuensis]|uniref:Lysophospholipase, alpha-beta hydrolase superfamily n=1 Tax=Agrococcus jejuensis TaxID=399736 RepID=A0A1G8DS62_9MICO|nr:alpha/beta hydrolase [Agrococcus jejuensis]SDH60503.1 Lysophospholipase, alpha-beta hydrolase superfamily [Agrococcus jejuensis]